MKYAEADLNLCSAPPVPSFFAAGPVSSCADAFAQNSGTLTTPKAAYIEPGTGSRVPSQGISVADDAFALAMEAL